MAVVDHDYCFRYVDIGSYGRNADGGIFQNCSLFPYLENELVLPKNGVLLGDDAFPLKPYLLKPYKQKLLIQEKGVGTFWRRTHSSLTYLNITEPILTYLA